LLGRLTSDLREVRAGLTRGRADRSAAAETALLDAAARYAELHAATTCALLWWANRERSLWGCAPGAAGWLRGVLSYLVDDRGHRAPDPADLEPAAARVIDLAGRGLLFSTVPIPLADHGHLSPADSGHLSPADSGHLSPADSGHDPRRTT